MLKSQKPQEVEKIKKLIDEHTVIGIVNMHKLPGKQLQQIRTSLKGKAKIRMVKKSIMFRAFKDAQKDIEPLKDNIIQEPALLITNQNPFEIFSMIKQSKSPSLAKAGDIAPNDIIIKKGPTSLPPGPAISTLQKVKLKTSVQGGKIAIMQDTVVCKAGETVTVDMAEVMGLLKMEPMEIGLNVEVIWEGGMLYDKNVLDIDVDVYIADIQRSVQHAINLSIESGFLTSESAPRAIQKAFVEARSLCIKAHVLEKDFIDEVLAKAVREAKALETLVPETPKEEIKPEESSTKEEEKTE